MRYQIWRVRYTDDSNGRCAMSTARRNRNVHLSALVPGGEGKKLERRRWVKKYTNRIESIIRDRVKRRKQVVLKGGYPP